MSKIKPDHIFTNSSGLSVGYEELIKKIYENAESKEASFLKVFNEITPMIKNINDAVVLSPVIISLQNASIKNDQNLVALANILKKQKTINVDQPTSEEAFTVDMRRQLLNDIKQYTQNIPGQSSDQ